MDTAAPGSPREGHMTVCSEPPKRPAGRTKFKETRHPLYRGVRRRGRLGQWVCEVRVRGAQGYRLWLGTFTTAEMAARAHDSAVLALLDRAACLNFADSAWRMLPVLAAGSSRFSSAREIKDAVAVAVVEFQRQRPVVSTSETHDGEKDVQGSPTPSELSTSSDLLDEHWFGGMDAGSYYASLAQGMLMEPPAARARSEDGGEYSGVHTPLWNYLSD
ncbi:hypothetical protein ACQJBY_050694 [Aegilops geniculata]